MIPTLTPQQQTISLFAGIGAILLLASLIGFVLKARVAKGQPHSVIDNLNARIKAWWVMVLVIGFAFLFGRAGVMLLFLFISFAALREFMTLTYTRGGDHNALAASFFIVLPVQYLLVYIGWYGLSSIFIPVYVFLFLPIIVVVAGDTKRFLERAAKMQWGLMICVYCISHVPALLTLDIPGYDGRELLLIVFLVVVVQSSDVLQYVWGKLFGRHKVAPVVSPSKTWEGLIGGVASATALGAALFWITPFTPVAGGAAGAGHHPDGLLRRPRDVGDQARPRRQGLGPDDRGPRRHARPPRLGGVRRADLLPPDPLLVDALDRGRQRAPAVPAQVEVRRRLFAARAARVRAGARAGRLDVAQHDQRALAVAVALDPHLRLRDVGRHVADDARRMLVEHVRLDAGLAQAVGDEPRVVALLRDVDADHARRPPGDERVDQPAQHGDERRGARRIPRDTAGPGPCSSARRSRAAARARRGAAGRSAA